MRKFLLLPCAMLAIAVSFAFAGDLPKRSIQCVTPDVERKKVHLESGELLLVEISNPSGNAEGMKINTGTTGLKLVHSAIRRDFNDQGEMAVGGQNIILLFEATKVTSGKLTVDVDQVFAKTDPFTLDVMVKAPAGAAAK